MTKEVQETLVVLEARLVFQFKKVGNDIQIWKVQKWNPDDPQNPDPVDITPVLGAPSPPNGKFTLGPLSKYIKNPTCISFEIGGSYYEICF